MATPNWLTEGVFTLLSVIREANATPAQTGPVRSHRQLSERNGPWRTGNFGHWGFQNKICSYILGKSRQSINKTNSAVQLIHKPTGIVVKSQATRSRTQNQKIAMGILAEKVELQLKGEQSRAAIKAETKKKKKASREKKARRKYRRLEEEKRKLGVEAEEGKEKGSEEVDSTESDEPVDGHEGENPDRKESGFGKVWTIDHFSQKSHLPFPSFQQGRAGQGRAPKGQYLKSGETGDNSQSRHRCYGAIRLLMCGVTIGGSTWHVELLVALTMSKPHWILSRLVFQSKETYEATDLKYTYVYSLIKSPVIKIQMKYKNVTGRHEKWIPVHVGTVSTYVTPHDQSIKLTCGTPYSGGTTKTCSACGATWSTSPRSPEDWRMAYTAYA
ncbi:hypothetical protein HCBG_02802 [Histoplasma capsulatum G186AR]|uniref:Prokaryotic-type class I peptide chain release factors domain-containing protein n=1 Tax=Ajellomyces capsulatus (strain G186AR / H82 / ATCC MYA-2454 / RMSCC 2432) TaxID=447093 RepID=C0NHI0_AJECG|nr:uncharacterized protein HCBG_02802 [Histoplasma capsulatum G186AR]EEH09265.1 hypothetical protein HCBG_02802 [Histoplasma capsulatum G186AR]